MMEPEPPAELLRCFDENGQDIEPHVRIEVHKKPLRWWHGTTGIWVVNQEGMLLCSHRSKLLDQNPGKWQTRFGGHVRAGQTYEQNAVEELQEETGLEIVAADLHQIGAVIKNEEYKHFAKQYVYLFSGLDSELTFPDGEVTEAKWLTMEEYNAQRSERPDMWTNGCDPEVQLEIKQWLQKR